MLRKIMAKALEDEQVREKEDNSEDKDLTAVDPVETSQNEEASTSDSTGDTPKEPAANAEEANAEGVNSESENADTSAADSGDDANTGEDSSDPSNTQTPSADDLAEPDEATIKILGIGDLAVDKVAEAESEISNKIKSSDADLTQGDLNEEERKVDVANVESIAEDSAEAMEAMRLDFQRYGSVAPGTLKLLSTVYARCHKDMYGQAKQLRGAMEDFDNPKRRKTALSATMEDWKSMFHTAVAAILAFIKKARRWFNEFVKAKFSFTIQYLEQIEKYTRAIVAQREANKDKIDGALINKTVIVGGKKTSVAGVGNQVLDKEHFIQDTELAKIFMAVNPNPQSQTGAKIVSAVHFTAHMRALVELSQRFVKIYDLVNSKFEIGDYLKQTVIDTINGDTQALHFSQGTREGFMSSKQLMFHDNPAVYQMHTKNGQTPEPLGGQDPDAGCAWWYIPYQFENYMSAVHIRVDVVRNGIPDNELDTVDMFAKWRLGSFGRAEAPYEGTGWIRWIGNSELTQCSELVLKALNNLRHVELSLNAYNKKVDALEKSVEEVGALLQEHHAVSNMTPSGISYTVDQLANMVLKGLSNTVSVLNSIMQNDAVYVQRIGMAWTRLLALIYARETSIVTDK